MKLTTYSAGGARRVGIVVEGGIVDLAQHVPGAPATLIELISRWPEFRGLAETASGRAPDLPLREARLHAPIGRPGKILAIGLNYADHCVESGLEIPKEQIWFSKAVTAVNGPFDPIRLPTVSVQLDYECEMVFVVGRRCRNVPRARAKEVIFGFCVGNDVSVRDWQLRTSQWTLGKSFDTHAPIGPWITTGEQLDPHALDIRCLVNGEQRQHSNTRNLVFDCYAQLECLSQAMTLEPGDLVFTGTCGGVGIAHRPPRWLEAGDLVRVEIGTLGSIENTVVPETGETAIE
jgi:2-keto-4-pentenoate hydratase/2-oxohepta-3-ene-1,7-dioic acid hydratase in catechol pathway